MMVSRWSVAVLLWLVACYCSSGAIACVTDIKSYEGFPVLDITGCSGHYEFGQAMGTGYCDMIKERVQESLAIRKINELLQNETLAGVYAQFLSLNQQQFPDYWKEMAGMADGAGVSLDEIVQLNLRQELLAAFQHPAAVREDACSDVLLPRGSRGTLLGHNEDMSNDTRGHVGFIRAKLGPSSWFAFVYAGELPSTAFGFSPSSRVAFTLNAVFPRHTRQPGVGRNMLSRALLQATDIKQALDIIQHPLGSSGHSYNLLDLVSGEVMNVEAGPGGACDVAAVESGWYFHANSYLHLPVMQTKDESSAHREAVANTYQAPRNASAILFLLGDTSDPVWPIYRRGDGGSSVSTLCTVLYDTASSRMIVYRDNPRKSNAIFSVDLRTMGITPFPSDAPKASPGKWWVA